MDMKGLNKNTANYIPLTPITFLTHAARIYPQRTAVIYGNRTINWKTIYSRCAQLAYALQNRGLVAGDVVSVVSPNIPEIFESHFAIPMAGCVLNTINIRLDADTLRYIFEHSEAKMILVETEFASKVKTAVEAMDNPPTIIDIVDPAADNGHRIGECDYETLIAEAKQQQLCQMPKDEWAPIALNYTSGTTGNPKGVVYHHRGAYLMSMGSIAAWQMPRHNTYLATVPMFHCNGWGYPWTETLLASTIVCMRAVSGDAVWELIEKHKIDFMGGAPIVLSMILESGKNHQLSRPVKVLVAGAPPPSTVLAQMSKKGFNITHVYGLTETYGHTTMCYEQDTWANLSEEEQFEKRAMQGVAYPILQDWTVLDSQGNSVPCDGETMGELALRGNTIMSGYLKDEDATAAVFDGDWFRTGDLGVMYPDSYLKIRDRKKDIIISGGENISSQAIENVLAKHPAVLLSAVVAKPDKKWGETPCAFIELREGSTAPTIDDIIAHCKANAPGFMCPRAVIFCELPKTATGKIKKYELRERVK